MNISPIPTYPKRGHCKSVTTDCAHHVGSSTIVVMTLFNFDNCQKEASEVIFGVVVDLTGMKAPVKFGDSR